MIRKLLEQGYTVHATVRDLNKKQSFAHLEKIAQENSGTLKLFKANLLENGSFDEAIEWMCEVSVKFADELLKQLEEK